MKFIRKYKKDFKLDEGYFKSVDKIADEIQKKKSMSKEEIIAARANNNKKVFINKIKEKILFLLVKYKIRFFQVSNLFAISTATNGKFSMIDLLIEASTNKEDNSKFDLKISPVYGGYVVSGTGIAKSIWFKVSEYMKGMQRPDMGISTKQYEENYAKNLESFRKAVDNSKVIEKLLDAARSEVKVCSGADKIYYDIILNSNLSLGKAHLYGGNTGVDTLNLRVPVYLGNTPDENYFPSYDWKLMVYEAEKKFEHFMEIFLNHIQFDCNVNINLNISINDGYVLGKSKTSKDKEIENDIAELYSKILLAACKKNIRDKKTNQSDKIVQNIILSVCDKNDKLTNQCGTLSIRIMFYDKYKINSLSNGVDLTSNEATIMQMEALHKKIHVEGVRLNGTKYAFDDSRIELFRIYRTDSGNLQIILNGMYYDRLLDAYNKRKSNSSTNINLDWTTDIEMKFKDGVADKYGIGELYTKIEKELI